MSRTLIKGSSISGSSLLQPAKPNNLSRSEEHYGQLQDEIPLSDPFSRLKKTNLPLSSSLPLFVHYRREGERRASNYILITQCCLFFLPVPRRRTNTSWFERVFQIHHVSRQEGSELLSSLSVFVLVRVGCGIVKIPPS